MKKNLKKNLLEIASNPLGASFLTVLGLFILRALFFKSFFLVNDDEFSLFIAKGVGISTRPDEHLLFNNVLFGLLLKKLYTLAPKIGWYPLCLLTIQFLSFWAFLWASLLRSRDRYPILPFGIVFLFVGPYYFMFMNYTMTSILAFLGGAFLWASLGATEGQKERGKVVLFLTLCLWLSVLLRRDGFLFAGLLSLPFLGPVFFQSDRKRQLIKLTLPALFLVVASVAYDQFHYTRDPQWYQFQHLYAMSADLQVNKVVEYNDKTKPLFDKIGWSHNDSDLFFNWFTLDDDKYSPALIQKIYPYFGHYRKEGLPIFSLIFINGAIQNLILCSLVFFFLTPKRAAIPLIAGSAWAVLFLLFLSFFARVPERLTVSAFLFMALLCVFFSAKPGGAKGPNGSWIKTPRLRKILWISLAICSIPALHAYLQINNYQKARSNLLTECVKGLDPKDSQLFTIWGSSFPYEAVKAFDDFEMFRGFNIFAFATFQRSPLAKAMLDRFGVKDFSRDLVDNPDIFLMCEKNQGIMYHKHMVEKYGLTVFAEKYYDCPLFKVYRIHSSKRGSRPARHPTAR